MGLGVAVLEGLVDGLAHRARLGPATRGYAHRTPAGDGGCAIGTERPGTRRGQRAQGGRACGRGRRRLGDGARGSVAGPGPGRPGAARAAGRPGPVRSRRRTVRACRQPGQCTARPLRGQFDPGPGRSRGATGRVAGAGARGGLPQLRGQPAPARRTAPLHGRRPRRLPPAAGTGAGGGPGHRRSQAAGNPEVPPARRGSAAWRLRRCRAASVADAAWTAGRRRTFHPAPVRGPAGLAARRLPQCPGGTGAQRRADQGRARLRSGHPRPARVRPCRAAAAAGPAGARPGRFRPLRCARAHRHAAVRADEPGPRGPADWRPPARTGPARPGPGPDRDPAARAGSLGGRNEPRLPADPRRPGRRPAAGVRADPAAGGGRGLWPGRGDRPHRPGRGRLGPQRLGRQSTPCRGRARPAAGGRMVAAQPPAPARRRRRARPRRA